MGRRIVTSTDRDTGIAAGTPRLEYQIKWGGFGQQQKSWRSIEYLITVYEMVAAYNRQQEEKGNPLPVEYQPLLPPLLRSSDDLPPPGPEERARKVPHFRPQFYPPSDNKPVAQPPATGDATDLEYLSIPRSSPPAAEDPAATEPEIVAPPEQQPKTPSVPRSVVALDRHRADMQPAVDTAPPPSPSAQQSERIRRRQARINRQLGVDMVATLTDSKC